MAEVISDWQRADSEHLSTYKRVMRLTVASTVSCAVILVLLAVFLL